MKKYAFFLLVLVGFIGTIDAQKIIAFDKTGKVKRIKYFQGEFIKLKLLSGQKVQGTIVSISDSSFIIDEVSVLITSVKKVYNTQKFYGFKLLGNVMFIAGVGYFSLDSFNNLISNESTVFSQESAKVSAWLITVGLISNSIANRSYKITKKRPLKILDITL